MDVTTFTAVLAIIFGASSFAVMIRQARAKRPYYVYETVVIVTFVVLWLLLIVLVAGVSWYFAVPGVAVFTFAVLHFHYRRLRRMIRSVK